MRSLGHARAPLARGPVFLRIPRRCDHPNESTISVRIDETLIHDTNYYYYLKFCACYIEIIIKDDYSNFYLTVREGFRRTKRCWNQNVDRYVIFSRFLTTS